MANTTFTSGTVIESSWLNDVNDATYEGTAVYTPTGTGAIATTVQTKLRESVSVKDFGAVGDGVTDDRAAIVLALAYLTSGGTLYFPAGTYLVSAAITVPHGNLQMQGDGFNASVIKIAASYADSTSLFDFSSVDNVEISDLGFNGNLANQGISSTADNKQIAIAIKGTSSNYSITRCYFKDWGKDGVYVQTANNRRVTVSECLFENTRRNGVTFIGGEQCQVVNCQFFLGKDQTNVVFNNGVHYEPNSAADNLKGLIVKGNSFHDMQGGVMLYNSNGGTVSGVIVEGNEFETITQRAAVVSYALGTAGITISGNRFRNCGNDASTSVTTDGGGIQFNQTANAIITDNSFDNCTGFLGTVVNSGSAGRGTIIKNNLFTGDQRGAIRLGYVNGSSSTGSLRQIVGNICLGGGLDTANTYTAISIANTVTHQGNGDVVLNNSIQISTTSGYGTGISVDQESGTSVVGQNAIVGSTGAKYSFTNGTPTQLYDYSRDVSATIDPASIANGGALSTDVTVSGAAVGDQVIFSPGVNVSGLAATATVRGVNTVQLVLANNTGAAVDLVSSTWKFKTIRPLV